MLILRHAWLNLWDERMTTGRINQVSIFLTHQFIIHWCEICEQLIMCTQYQFTNKCESSTRLSQCFKHLQWWKVMLSNNELCSSYRDTKICVTDKFGCLLCGATDSAMDQPCEPHLSRSLLGFPLACSQGKDSRKKVNEYVQPPYHRCSFNARLHSEPKTRTQAEAKGEAITDRPLQISCSHWIHIV